MLLWRLPVYDIELSGSGAQPIRKYMDDIFSPQSLSAMCDLRDAFDSSRRANPAKVIPTHRCREWLAAPSTRAAEKLINT